MNKILSVDYIVDKSTLYYEVIVIGVPQIDENTHLPILDENGNVKVKFSRLTEPPEKLQTNSNLRKNPWFQCQMIEANLGEDVKTSASGKKFRIGAAQRKAYPQNIFYNTHNLIYMDIYRAIENKEFKWLVKVDKDTAKQGNAIIMITGEGGEKASEHYVIPGHAYEFPTGFPYQVLTRDKQSKELKDLLSTSYNDKGEVTKNKVIKTTGNIFLFKSEIENAEAHIQNMINVCKRTKIETPVDLERHEEALNAADIQTTGPKGGTADEEPPAGV